MTDCMPIQTPIVVSDTKSTGVEDYSNASYYMMLVGSLQYLTITRPDIAFCSSLYRW